jgi:hypothetical protein
MFRENAAGIARTLGCLWLGVAALTTLLILMALGSWVVVWPLGLAAMGMLELLKPSRRALLVGAAGGVVATAFAIWAASVSSAGNENTALIIAAFSAALAVASAATWFLMPPASPGPPSRDIQRR